MTFPALSLLPKMAGHLPRQRMQSLYEEVACFPAISDSLGIYYFNPFDPASTPEPNAPEKEDVLQNG